MNTNDLNTEQIIMQAAEVEFLENGYGNTKMMAIAKRANVVHSMLHYYFRNKETLFQKVFLAKAQTLLPLFDDIFKRELPFEETVRLFMETQFDFFSRNPKLPLFLVTEILSNKNNRNLLFEVLYPKVITLIGNFEKALAEEITKGNIRPIKIQDFMMNVISINASTFITLPILQIIANANSDEDVESRLKARKESNVQFVLKALRP